MSNGYRDICDFNEELINTEGEDSAPSNPWGTSRFPGVSQQNFNFEADTSGLPGLDEQAAITARISPKLEIRDNGRTRFFRGVRFVKIYPQHLVYNFPLRYVNRLYI